MQGVGGESPRPQNGQWDTSLAYRVLALVMPFANVISCFLISAECGKFHDVANSRLLGSVCQIFFMNTGLRAKGERKHALNSLDGYRECCWIVEISFGHLYSTIDLDL